MKKIMKKNTDFVEFETEKDVESTNAHSDNDFKESSLNDNVDNGYDENEDDYENEDEDSALQRLTGNYRKFSETQRSRQMVALLNPEEEESVEQNVEISTRNLNPYNGLMDSDSNESDHEDYEEFGDMDNNHNDENKNDNNNDNDEASRDGSLESDEIEADSALRMLESALSASRSSNPLEAFSGFFNNRNTNSSDTIDSSSSVVDSSRERNRNIINSFMDHFGSSSNSEITGLMNGLKTHNDPYMIMETLNQLSTSLLMMSSLQSERQVPTYKLAKILVDTINSYPDHLELQLVACRCIYNLTEVNFNLINEIVSAGVVECLNQKLADLSYIDMAEQALQALEMISRKCGLQCLKKGSIPIALSYLDFFTIHAQRKALKIASNSTSFKYIPGTCFNDISTILPVIKNVLINYSDSQCVEYSWIFLSNVINNFYDNPILIDLLDADFMKQLFTKFAPFTNNNKQSSGLVSFKTSLALLDSLTLLSSESPKFSNELLLKCDVPSMITSTFSSYENEESTNTSMDESTNTQEIVSIDALLNCPKSLILSILKFISTLIPLASEFDITDSSDIGNYFSMNEKDLNINDTKFDLLNNGDNNKKVLDNFFTTVYPVILNVYDATVDYKTRRLVFVLIIRFIYLMNKNQLESIICSSKTSLILASSITHGKKIVDKKDNQTIKSYTLLFGAIFITKKLMELDFELFTKYLSREGMFTQLDNLSTNIKNEISKLTHKDKDGDIELEYDDRNSSNDEDDNNSYDQEYDEEDPDDDMMEGETSFFNTVRKVNVLELSIMNDGLSKQSIKTILNSLYGSLKPLTSENKVSITNESNYLYLFMEHLEKCLVEESSELSKEEWDNIWSQFASILDRKRNPNSLSTYGLVISGIIDHLLERFEKEKNHETACLISFKYIFCSALSPCIVQMESPLYFLVKILEDALDRNETFEIFGADLDANQTIRAKATMMSRQMKVNLIPYDAVPSTYVKTVTLSVPAIGTFDTIQRFFDSSKSISLRSKMNGAPLSDDEQHFEFYMKDVKVPTESTIFGAVYKYSGDGFQNMKVAKEVILRKIYNVKYKVVDGKYKPNEGIISNESLDDTINRIGDPEISSILLLLKSLHSINATVPNPSTSEIAFLNYKLIAKLNCQLDDPLLVASDILPDWASIIPREFPFLFPIETRLSFLKSTSFGYSRLIDYWSNKAKESSSNSDEQSEANEFLRRSLTRGRSARHKLRVQRDKIFASAIKTMEVYGSNPGLIEIEFFDECGSGLGPTLEFYSEVSREFSKLNLNIWRSGDYHKLEKLSIEEQDKMYVKEVHGLFPKPTTKSDPHYVKALYYFKILGKFLARSFLDSRLVDFHFNPLFFELAMDYCLTKNFKFTQEVSIEKISEIDPNLAASLNHLKLYLEEFKHLPKEQHYNVKISDATISDLMLTFVLPGYENIKLLPNGDEISVTSENISQYIDLIVDYTIYNGISDPIKSFVEGFSEILPFKSLKLFSPNEITRLTGNEVENWSTEVLISVIHADHGYNSESQQIKWLIEIMSKFDVDQRRNFLKFVTGSPRLPHDGFAGLSPTLTVVLKHCEDDLKPEDYLPSVMTCANYLKLPCYSTYDVMYSRITQAMTEGNGAFHLS